MSVTLRMPQMTRDAFLDWAAHQEERYEFDGIAPVAMTGGVANHSLIAQNLYFALRLRLRDGPCRVLGPDAGLATAGDAVRYPDALVTCSKFAGSDRLIPGVLAVFEVLSPTSGRVDRIDKLREYRAVPTIRSYVVLEHGTEAVTVMLRDDAASDWTATARTAAESIHLPAIGVELPVAELYAGIEFA